VSVAGTNNFDYQATGDDPSMNTWDMAKEFWHFLKVRKKFWLLPIVLITLLFGALILFTTSSPMAPFIYTLFKRHLESAAINCNILKSLGRFPTQGILPLK